MDPNFKQLLNAVLKRRMWIFVPVVAFTAVALGYSLLRQEFWSSSQALLIRDESFGQITPLGRFESVDSMQTAQETMYEVAHHPTVLRKAMKDVGPYKTIWSPWARKAWPTPGAVDGFGKRVSVSAPNGAEFGRTEMVYLSVKAETPNRATELTKAVTQRLIEQMKLLRRQKYKGIVDELERSASLAKNELQKAMAELEEMEQRMGSDVVEMRVLNNESMGSSTVRQALTAVQSDLRQAKEEYGRKKAERNRLLALRDDPASLISAPNKFLSQHPTLQGLQNGLAEARMNYARLAGEMSSDHPEVVAAENAVKKVKSQLYIQIRQAIAAVDADVTMTRKKVIGLIQQARRYEDKFANISNMRSTYSRLTKEVEQRQEFIEKVETDLATAKANMVAATEVSTIQTIHEPVSSINPIGPGKTTICLAGMMGGLFTGLGLIWLLEPIGPNPSDSSDSTPRRLPEAVFSELAPPGGFKRRMSDHFRRRTTDWIDRVWPGGPPKGDGASTVPSNSKSPPKMASVTDPRSSAKASASVNSKSVDCESTGPKPKAPAKPAAVSESKSQRKLEPKTSAMQFCKLNDKSEDMDPLVAAKELLRACKEAEARRKSKR